MDGGGGVRRVCADSLYAVARIYGGDVVICGVVGLAEVFIEEIDRPLPGEFRSSLVETGGCIVVKAVVDVGIDISLVCFVVFFEGCLERWPAVGDTGIETGVLKE